jgi:ice-binding like protein/Big-like domain-containing protein
MNQLKAGFLFVLVSALSACGGQVVDFDAASDGGANSAPTVTSSLPVNNATGVALNPAISATFSKAMDAATLSATTFTLKQGTTSLSGAVSVDGATRTVTFAPAAALATSLVYTATITTGAKDSKGVAMAAAYVWSFTTAAGAAPPTVLSTTPLALAVDVPVSVKPTATFSQAMAAGSLSATTFTLKQGATAVSGAVTLDAATHVATFTPAAALANGLLYTATVTTGAKDSSGVALAANHSWTFTTAALTAAPTVVSTTPLDLATNVSINARPTATFSQGMDPATVGATTFAVTDGVNPVSGAVTLDGATNTATFTPAAPLRANVLYTATITTGAKNPGGTALAANHAWSFTTAACGQLPVALGAASNFVVLAGSTVTNTGLTTITGDLGVSPGTAVTGFGPGILVGALHAGDPTAAQGIADLTTAYNDAAGRTLCPVSVAGNLGGQTLAPGLYKSTSSLEISSGDLTLDAQGDGQAVFIFQMAATLTTTVGRQVILVNGAKAANVFWQVGSSATLGTNSSFQGTIMADQAVTLTTGATLNGRALARIAAVALDTNTVVKPAP